MVSQSQTAASFLAKWTNNRSLAFDETLRDGSELLNWILSRNGLKDLDGLGSWLASRKRILDAGCGNGRITALLRRASPETTAIVAVDLTSIEVAKENLKGIAGIQIEKRDLLEDLTSLGKFDLIYCQEVLHHLADPAAAFHNLCRQLAPGGEIAIYVYKKKSAVREFADDHVRSLISGLQYEEAMKAMREITEFGRVLSSLNAEVEIPAVSVLGIPAGKYDVQRLIYNYFAKCFWNADLSFEDNAAINYDWYHPSLCSRHTLEEVLDWFAAAGLDVIHECVDDYGITVRGLLPA